MTPKAECTKIPSPGLNWGVGGVEGWEVDAAGRGGAGPLQEGQQEDGGCAGLGPAGPSAWSNRLSQHRALGREALWCRKMAGGWHK